mgnify:CR=1 FL=1
MADILKSGFGVFNPTYGSLTKVNFDSEEAGFFSQLRKTVTTNFGERASSANGAMMGIVMRIDGYTNLQGSIDPLNYMAKGNNITGTISSDSARLIQIRVRIPEIHSCLPIPSSIPSRLSSHVDHDIINLYPVFVARTASTIIPALGSLVWVDFQNRETMQGPIYIEPVDPSAVGVYSTSTPSGRGTFASGSNPYPSGSCETELFEIPWQPDEDQASIHGYYIQWGARNENFMQKGARDAMLWVAAEYSWHVSSLEGDFGATPVWNPTPVPDGTPRKPFFNFLVFGDASTNKFGERTSVSDPHHPTGFHRSHRVGEDIDIGTPWNTVNRTGFFFDGTRPDGSKIQFYKFSNRPAFRRHPTQYVNLDAYVILFQAIFDAPDNVTDCPPIRAIYMNKGHLDLKFPTSHLKVSYQGETLRKIMKDIMDNSTSSRANGALKGTYIRDNLGYNGNHFHVRFDYPCGGD